MNKIILVLLLVITSCVSQGNKKTIALYKNLKSENLTTEELLNKYGKSTYEWKDQAGNTVHNYDYTYTRYDAMSYFPILYFFGNIKAENYSVNIVIDKDGVIKDKKGFYAAFKTDNGSMCIQWDDKCTKIVSRETK